MPYTARAIKPFIGARDFAQSRAFYRALGFAETVIDASMSSFRASAAVSFYLQDYYVADWVDNTMLFLEVDDVEAARDDLLARDLPATFPGVQISQIKVEPWGREFFVHDPSGILWHVGAFDEVGQGAKG